jgi:hypothetical protein
MHHLKISIALAAIAGAAGLAACADMGSGESASAPDARYTQDANATVPPINGQVGGAPMPDGQVSAAPDDSPRR